MSQDRNRAVATATFGVGGVAGGAALRQSSLMDAYGERPGKLRIARPAVLAERRLLKHPTGRRKYVAGATLAALSLPAASRGIADTFNKRTTFVEDGVAGVADSLRQRNQNARKAPAKLVAGNYLASGATAAAVGTGASLLLRRRGVGPVARAALASTTGAVGGTASVPLQRKLAERSSGGAYTATPLGLKRVVKPVNHGARHGTRVAKKDASTGMSRREELAAIKRKRHSAAISAGTSVGGIGSLGLLGAAALPRVRNRAALVRTATTLGTASGGVSALNGLESSTLYRHDLKAREKVLTSKAIGMPRAPRIRRGFLRQTRTATGLISSTVRGGLVR